MIPFLRVWVAFPAWGRQTVGCVVLYNVMIPFMGVWVAFPAWGRQTVRCVVLYNVMIPFLGVWVAVPAWGRQADAKAAVAALSGVSSLFVKLSGCKGILCLCLGSRELLLLFFDFHLPRDA